MAGGATVALRVVYALWCLPQTVVGLLLCLICHGCAHERFRLSRLIYWRRPAGLSLGLFIFVPRGCPEKLVVHEYGHTLQSALLGPLYLPLVVVPSLIWAGLPALERYRRRTKTSYYAVYPEKWASDLGERICRMPAAR